MQPLKRALADATAWMTGLRRDQSITRTDTPAIEWDEGNGMVKVNPIIEWSNDDVWAYIKANKIPYNKLHDKGFPSIGCAPAPGRSSPARTSAPAAGGGRTPSSRSAACTSRTREVRNQRQETPTCCGLLVETYYRPPAKSGGRPLQRLDGRHG